MHTAHWKRGQLYRQLDALLKRRRLVRLMRIYSELTGDLPKPSAGLRGVRRYIFCTLLHLSSQYAQFTYEDTFKFLGAGILPE